MDNMINIINLIEKYKKDLKYISGQSEKEIFTSFYNKINRTFIEDWINTTFRKTSTKCKQKSTEFRCQGNRDFLLNNFEAAIKNYTESLNFAPRDSENFSLALANRSAVFFALKDFKNCIKDIKVCLEHFYPENLKYKIYLRLINSYFKLYLFENALETIEILNNYLKTENNSLTDLKKEKIKSEILEIQKEISEKNDLGKNEPIFDDTKIPEFEENSKFAFASKLISLQYSDVKGRYVTASDDIKMGDIIFLEKPFTYVPIFPEDPVVKSVCYHCFTTLESPIPCKNCKTQFCSQECCKHSWDTYHRFECTGSCIDIWPQIGVNYLAMRLLVLGASSGYKNVFNRAQNDVEHFGDRCDNYDYVCSLVTNVEKMDKVDVFPHVVSAVVITTYLLEKTDFSDFVLGYLPKTDATTPENRENLPYIIGSVLLKHILQVIANAATIELVNPEFYKLFNSTEQINENGYYFSGVGMYPSCSMMNHSCEPNITNYFIKNYIIVKAKFDIKKGAEIFNSYGYDCRRHVTIGRKDELKKQHFFDCTCTACNFPSKPEIFHEGLLCQACNELSLPKDNKMYRCYTCHREFNAKNHFQYIRKAESLFQKWQVTKNISHLIKCLELREKVFYKYNFSIYTTNLDLQTFYGEKGDIQLWWVHTQKTLDLDAKVLGENSLRVGMNLRLCLLILLRYFMSLSLEEKNNIRQVTLTHMIGKAMIMFEKMKKIFVLYYDENLINFQEIDEMLQDAIAIATHILGENLYIDTIEDALHELYVDSIIDQQIF